MDYKEIRGLLEKYWEGDSSLEEEALLQNFFNSNQEELPEDLAEAAPMFLYFRHKAEEKLHLQAEIPEFIPVKKVRFNAGKTLAYAASLMIILAVGYFIRQQAQPEEKPPVATFKTREIDDPERAYAETKKALLLLSVNLNKGTSQVQKLSYFNEATTIIEGKN